jgi:hypothetical protein
LSKAENATHEKNPWNPPADFPGNFAELHTVNLTVNLNDREVGQGECYKDENRQDVRDVSGFFQSRSILRNPVHPVYF